MSEALSAAPSQSKVLRRLYLTLFLRGRSSRGLTAQQGTPSIGKKLGFTLFFYALIGCMGLTLLGQSLFSLSIYLHGASMFFVGMFVASSSGELLFNEDESEILLHRPVSPKAMLWAKVSVLLQVSFWLILAFNLAGLVGGSVKNLMFLPAHLISSGVLALFCTAGVVLVYQLCLRWFGRERLDGLMTFAQVVMTLIMVLGSQMVPRILLYLPGGIELGAENWWLSLLPPVWFAALDETLAGRGDPVLWGLAGFGVSATALIVFLAFGKLAQSYQSGLQMMGESAAPCVPAGGRGRWIRKWISIPPLAWWLRNPVERAGFHLVTAYIFRDRDVKLRLYPGLAPIAMMPLIFMFNGSGQGGDSKFMMILSGSYLPVIPMLALNLLRFSQHWQAADVFLITPTTGPGRLIIGARKAANLFLTLPALIVMAAAVAWMGKGPAGWAYLLPGLLALPVYGRVACLGKGQLPFSLPGEAAKSAGRGLMFMLAMISAMSLGGIGAVADHMGYFWQFLCIEALLAILGCFLMDRRILKQPWATVED